eukprot:707298-Rhodomonas_salina.1
MQRAHADAETQPVRMPQFVLSLLPPIEFPQQQQQPTSDATFQPSFAVQPWYSAAKQHCGSQSMAIRLALSNLAPSSTLRPRLT